MKFHIENQDEFPYLNPGDMLVVIAPDHKWYRVWYGRKPRKITHVPDPTSRACQNFKSASQKVKEIFDTKETKEYWENIYKKAKGIYKKKAYKTLSNYLFARLMANDIEITK